MPEFSIAVTDKEFSAAKKLFEEYLHGLQLDLSFQNVEKELLQLKEMYAFPDGGIVLCKVNNTYAGCVGIRKLDKETAEMKRLFVQVSAQRKGIATQLIKEAERLAFRCGYQAIRLDTLNTMTPAMNLYLANGYTTTPPYYHNPIETAVYFYKKIDQLNLG